MNCSLRFLGGCGEVGRSAVLIDDDILLDYGMKPGESSDSPPSYPLNGIHPRTIIISHGHLDHCGVVPNIMDIHPQVYSTPITKHLTAFLAKDTLSIARRSGQMPLFDSQDIQEFMQSARIIDYRDRFECGEYTAQLYDAGHIPGSASILLESENGIRILYTGDVNHTDTRLLNRACPQPKADVMITESTYFGTDHTPRKELEQEFVDSIRDTLNRGGNAIVPCFAIGRTQEVLMILHKHGLHPYVDGMGVDVLRRFIQYPECLRDSNALQQAFDNATVVKPERRARILKNSLIVTTAGMLNGGPALFYLGKIHDDPESKILLTGYQVEGTNGYHALAHKRLTDRNRVLSLRMTVEQYDFSAHSGDAELKRLVQKFCDQGGEFVFMMHGDRTEEFAAWAGECKIDATAPANGDEFTIE
ncbi:MAG: mRNA 3'-end processing factor [Candidatus Methanogaster sp.]|uniref:mRNA 3'-end processing factor n=1 Tax=Candidatus Methanogaster sp. TaxID=3386292 RepID=A0AC61KYS4_9EURY|nr:MAG: mRNA 3'-end processing factor [ANME-2 cluster archaeon]